MVDGFDTSDTKPKQIYGLMSKVMAGIGAVGKDKKNAAQGYMFRGIDQVYNAIHGAMSEHGVFPVPRVLEQKREERASKSGGTMFHVVLTVETRFYAPDGSSVAAVTVGEAMDSSDKASNKAMSVAMKYALLETFCIPTEEQKDPENDSPQVEGRGPGHGAQGELATPPPVSGFETPEPRALVDFPMDETPQPNAIDWKAAERAYLSVTTPFYLAELEGKYAKDILDRGPAYVKKARNQAIKFVGGKTKEPSLSESKDPSDKIPF